CTLVEQLEPVVAELDEITMLDRLRFADSNPVDEAAIITLEIVQYPTGAVPRELAVVTGNVALRQPDGVVLGATNRVLVPDAVDDRLVLLVVLDGQLPHR